MDTIKKPDKSLEIPANFKQLCRFCLKGASKKIDNKSLELFKLLTNVELVCSPEYPKFICSLCESQLQSACKFRVSLLDMERCWSQFFWQDYQQFIRSIDIEISEENIYDEIVLDEMNANDQDITSNQSFDQVSIPLIQRSDQRTLQSRKSSYLRTQSEYRSVEFLQFDQQEIHKSKEFVNFSKKNKSDRTLNVFYSRKHKEHKTVYLQSSQNTRIMQNMQASSFTEDNQTFEFEDFSYQSGSDDQMSARHLTERNHDIVSLSYETVNECLPEENKLLKRKTQVSKANKVEIKCVVVGDGAVGKSNLIFSYLIKKFIDHHVPTASDIYKFDVKVDKQSVQVMLYDTAGQDSLDHLRQLSYPDCHVFLLCFSVVQPESFNAVKIKWIPTLRNTSASLVLVGTQSDLRDNSETIANLKRNGLRPVSLSEAWDLANLIGSEYIETSALNNVGVKNAFDTAIVHALSAIETNDSKVSSFWRKWICLS